tara:strand:- start:729 stop:1094 length:366 start_codon:yes stop_codon:yes gene_type:complete
MIGSDGLGYGSKPHPRHFGTFPRVLGHYARNEEVLSMKDAIHKMTGMPAAKFNLIDRGIIREDAFADLVIFDPLTIIDRATYENPRQNPTGVPWVIVNGSTTVRDSIHTGALAGYGIRRGQ